MNRSALRWLLCTVAMIVLGVACTVDQARPTGIAAMRSRQRAPGHDFTLQSGALVAHVGVKGASSRVDVRGDSVRISSVAEGVLFGMRVARVGRKGSLVAMPNLLAMHAESQEAVLSRDGLEERYLAGPLGLEQILRVDASPPGDGPLAIEIAFDGLAPDPRTQPDAGSVSLVFARGVPRAVYEGLAAEDAAGRVLPAHMEISGATITLVIDDARAAYPVEIDPLIAVLQNKLTTSDPARYFGAVSIDGDTAIVGAPFMSNGDPGAAYVFVRSGGAWSRQAKLVADVGASLDGFGTTVSISGDTAVVGAPYASHSTGAAYVFVRSAGTWTLEATLTASDAARAAQFGFSADVDQDTIVLGAYGDSLRVGAAYVFVRSGGAWGQQAKLTGSDVVGGGVFGYSVSLLGDTALVGAYGVSGLRGAGYVFTRSAAVWTQQAKLHAGDSAPQDLFGYATSLGADTAVLGAYGAANSSGAAYVFRRSGASWSQEAKLVANDLASGDNFGAAVSVSGEMALLGAYGQSTSTGAAYVFSWSAGAWSQGMKITAADGASADNFGRGVSMSARTALIGAPSRQAGQPGAAYVFGVGLDLGSPCTVDPDCASGSCADSVCCDSACGGGPCDACSAASGASADGSCTSFTGTSCDDGHGATVCVSGACIGINLCTGVACAPLDQCHSAGVCTSWATGNCTNPLLPDGTACNDGNASTTNDACAAGACSGVDHCVSVVCVAADQCHVAGTCVDHAAGTCSNPAAPNGTPCDDLDPSTTGDACRAGACAGVDHCLGVVCTAHDQCHVPGVCTDHLTGVCGNPPAPDGTVCDDGDPTTTNDTCIAGSCGGADHCVGVTCSAMDQCHTAGVCVDHSTGECSTPTAADGASCDDGDPITEGDVCRAGVCSGVSVPVDAGSPPVDAGSPPVDAGSPPVDAGSLPVDAGDGSPDAGMVSVDAGTTDDAGTEVIDAGAPLGSAEADAGVASVDASVGIATPDAGVRPLPTNEELFGPNAAPASGCSCRTAGGVSSEWGPGSGNVMLLGVMLWLSVRRRRSRDYQRPSSTDRTASSTDTSGVKPSSSRARASSTMQT